MKSRYLRKSSTDAGYSNFSFQNSTLWSPPKKSSQIPIISYEWQLCHMIWHIWCLRTKNCWQWYWWHLWDVGQNQQMSSPTSVTNIDVIGKNFVEMNLKTFLMRHSLVLDQIVYTWYLRNHFHEHHAFHLHVKPPTIMDLGNWCWNIRLFYWNYSKLAQPRDLNHITCVGKIVWHLI